MNNEEESILFKKKKHENEKPVSLKHYNLEGIVVTLSQRKPLSYSLFQQMIQKFVQEEVRLLLEKTEWVLHFFEDHTYEVITTVTVFLNNPVLPPFTGQYFNLYMSELSSLMKKYTSKNPTTGTTHILQFKIPEENRTEKSFVMYINIASEPGST